MHTLFPPYPNRIALDIYQSLAAPFIRSTTTPPQLPHINSWASELCPPPSTGALTRLWRYNVSDIGGIPAFDTTPWTSARLPGAGSHNELKVRSRASSGTISAISARYLLYGLHTRQTLAPSPSSSFYLACHLHTFLASSCRRTTNAITGAPLSFCHAEFQLLITPLVLPWLDTGRLSNS